MSNAVNLEVTGFKELVEQLKKIGDDKSKKRETILLLRQIAKPTLQAAKQIVPVRRSYSSLKTKKTFEGGKLKKSLGLINSRKAYNPTVYVGPRAKGDFSGWYGHFVHEGHNIYRKGFKRKRTGGTASALFNAKGSKARTKANPFLTNAYRATQTTVTADAEKKMAAFIQRRINKLS